MSRPLQTVGRGSDAYLSNQLLQAHKTIATLRAQLCALNIDSFNRPPEWASGLSQQETFLMLTLLFAHPRCVTKSFLLDNLPALDHTRERNPSLVDNVVCRVRKTLGFETIENIWGKGYRCSDEFASRYKTSTVP